MHTLSIFHSATDSISDASLQWILQKAPTDNNFILKTPSDYKSSAGNDGDFKIKYSKLNIGKKMWVTVIAQQNMGSDGIAHLSRYITEDSDGIEILKLGRHSIDSFFVLDLEQDEEILWLLRFLTFFMIMGGCYIWCYFFKELIVELPIIGALHENGSQLMLSCIFGVICYFILFGLSYSYYHVFVGMVIVSGIFLLFCFVQSGVISFQNKSLANALDEQEQEKPMKSEIQELVFAEKNKEQKHIGNISISMKKKRSNGSKSMKKKKRNESKSVKKIKKKRNESPSSSDSSSSEYNSESKEFSGSDSDTESSD